MRAATTGVLTEEEHQEALSLQMGIDLSKEEKQKKLEARMDNLEEAQCLSIMAASAAVDRFERENGIVGLDEVTDETRQQGFGTCPEPYDSRVDDRARSEKAESRKVRPGLCPTRILQGGQFSDKQWLQDGTDADWENFNPKQVQVMMVTLTALPMYTGDVRVTIIT